MSLSNVSKLSEGPPPWNCHCFTVLLPLIQNISNLKTFEKRTLFLFVKVDYFHPFRTKNLNPLFGNCQLNFKL